MDTHPNTYRNFDVLRDERGVTTITLDVPDRPLNTFDRLVMSELTEIVSDLEKRNDIPLVLIRSGKESGFIAGADIQAIADIETSGQAGRLVEEGQSLFQRIESLPMPTIAVIHGPCLGGGLELALACSHRVARNNSSTRIGLPEIKLGLIPGWGGTQRLPKLVGLNAALPMILTGKHLNARKALRMGLIDRAIGPIDWARDLSIFVDEVLHDAAAASAKIHRPAWKSLVEETRLGRSLIFRITERSIRSKTKHYPALDSALQAIRMGYEPATAGEFGEAGFACERAEFVKLLWTSTCRSLLDLFFARERSRTLKTWSPDVGRVAHDRPIRKVGIVGAGAMGAGIGQLSAYRGFDVVLKEVNDAAAEAGRERIAKLVDVLVKRMGWDQGKRQQLLDRVSVSCDDASLADCDLVIEAVVENEKVKADVFRSLDEVVRKSSILASNTSSLSIANMAKATNRPTRVAGLHFFNPVHRMELVEVVRAQNTDEETVARLTSFVRALGKTPVVTSDSPGFLVNRVLFPYLGEAVLMAGEAFNVATLDQHIRKFGMPMGPLELLDQVGLDVALHVATSLKDVLPGVDTVVDQLAVMVDQGSLGKKSGVGFYHYKKGRRGRPSQLPQVKPGSIPPVCGNDYISDGLTCIQRRLIYPMLAEAIRCDEEKVVSKPWAIDLAMVLGTGFAPHRGGPLHVIDAIGPHQVLGNLNRLRQMWGDRFTPPKKLTEMARRNQLFFEPSDVLHPPHPASS